METEVNRIRMYEEQITLPVTETPTRLMGALERIGAAVVSPRALSVGERENPRFGLPVAVVFLTSAVLLFHSLSNMKGRFNPFQLVFFLTTPIGVWIAAGAAFGLLAFYSYLFGARRGWGALFNVVCYSFVPVAGLLCILALLEFLGIRTPDTISPALFFRHGIDNQFAVFLLNRINLGEFLLLFVYYHGLRGVFDFSSRKALTVILYYYLTIVSLRVILFSLRMLTMALMSRS